MAPNDLLGRRWRHRPHGRQAAPAASGGQSVPVPLLETKLRTPRARRVLIRRPRLDALLDRSWDATLTLVAGPAGFGKTTVLADWTTRTVVDGRRAAWLSLDERDSHPPAFWDYVVSSLHTVAPDVGSAALDLLRAPQPSVTTALRSLLNDLHALERDVALVLDDYHLVQASDVHEQTVFLL